ncbi:MAG: DNA internalization-related competence protein ComEC/Rec2 [Kofleriaceae bacterium]|nr:DNA internalization-related competence protein ComEC/Rec2 [Kofleriaceae bacterium]
MSAAPWVRPLPIALAFAAGIVAARSADLAALPWWALAIGLVLFARGVRHAFLVVALALGTARGAPESTDLPDGVRADDRMADRVVGVVDGPVGVTTRGFAAALDTGTLTLRLWTAERIDAGERVAATGLVRSLHTPRGPGLPVASGPAYELTAQRLEHLADEPDWRDELWRRAARTQARWVAAIEAAGGDPVGRAALAGIVAGQRTQIPPELDERWRATGIYHALSVSGLHLAVVAGLVFMLLRRLVAASPLGAHAQPARWAAPPALAIAIAYTLITGAQLATVRALLVVALMLVAAMLDRPLRLVDALGAAALAILAWRPGDILEPSFQLSFTAALVLALLPPIEAPGVRGWLWRGLRTSTFVTLATAPITAYHFQQISLGGIVGNLVLTPLVEMVALPLALAGIAIGAVGAPLIHAATWIVTQVDRGAGLLAHVSIVGHVAVARGVVLVVLVGLSLLLVARRRRTWRDLVLWTALCGTWMTSRVPVPTGTLRVTFLDVGQGDAALVELPDGDVWLVDAGGLPNAGHLTAAIGPGDTIRRALAAYGHDHIDLAILSHPHPDHYLGLLGIGVPIKELWSASPSSPNIAARGRLPSFPEVVAALALRGTKHAHPPLGVARTQAGVELEVWGPRYQPADGAREVGAEDPVRSVNDNSLVVLVRYRGRSILFAGDLEHEGEAVAVAAGLPHVDVVKVAHHGSPTSSTQTFVDATRPVLAVISCGRSNPFGFPSPEVLARWAAAGAATTRTDTEGTVTVTIDEQGRLAW